MPDSILHDGDFDRQTDGIIAQYGRVSVNHMLGLIADAVREGDDEKVLRLDRMLRIIERRQNETGQDLH